MTIRKMIKFLLILLFIVFPLGELTKLPIGLTEINISLLDLLVAGLVVIWLIGQIGGKKSVSFERRVLAKPILFFIGAAIISLLVNSFRLSQKELIVASLYLIRWVVYAGVYFVVYDLTKFQSFKVSRFKTGLILAGVLTAIFGLLQYFLYPDLRNLSYLGWDPHKFRAFGTFLDPNFLGIILVLTIILIVDWQIEKCHSRPDRESRSVANSLDPRFRGDDILRIFFLFCCYLVLALTYSRSSYLAYLMGIGLISLIKKTPKVFLTAVLIAILTLLFLPKPSGSVGVDLQREDTIASRINNWKQSFVIAKDHPLFGVGFNAYRYAQKDYGFLKEENSHAAAGGDSSLLFVFATTGIIGTIAYLYLIYDILIYHIRKRDYLVVISLLAVVVHSFFNNTLFYPWVMLWLWVIIGLAQTDPEPSSG